MNFEGLKLSDLKKPIIFLDKADKNRACNNSPNINKSVNNHNSNSTKEPNRKQTD